ncbi:MAG: hypothetical protein AAGG75_19525 [Bacteroidota bacterium]
MKSPLILFFAVLFLLFSHHSEAQQYAIEGGVGIGGIAGKKHDLGKAEIYASLLRRFTFGDLGLDFATGGNFIPGTRSTEEPGTEILSPNDTRFGAIALLYRRYFGDHFFVEPRMGYTSLSAFIHTDDQRKIDRSNLSAGFGIGGTSEYVNLSLRYQYLGRTSDYRGLKDGILVESVASPVSVILLRISFRFQLK